MAYCPYCGAESGNDNFCPTRGQQVNVYADGSQERFFYASDPVPGFFGAYGRFWMRTAAGRASRTEYWLVMIWHFLISLPLIIVSTIASSEPDHPFKFLVLIFLFFYAIYFIFCLFPGIDLFVRRLHDVGLSGWCWLLVFVPFVGVLFVLILGFLPPRNGDNEYGAQPVPRRNSRVPF